MNTNEQRQIFYDNDLQIEAYQLTGIVQKFPNHFHEYYVIGYIEGGCRHLWCKGMEYDLKQGDVILVTFGMNVLQKENPCLFMSQLFEQM